MESVYPTLHRVKGGQEVSLNVNLDFLLRGWCLKLYFFYKEEASIIIFVKCYDLFVRGLKCRLWLKDNIPGRRSIFQEGA